MNARTFAVTMLAVILLTMLAVAPAAEAACAWVLWSDLITGTAGRTEREWQLGVAVATMADCHAKMRQQIELRVKAGETLRGDTLSSEAAGTHFMRRLICLPDTVDPRGPKGGAR